MSQIIIAMLQAYQGSEALAVPDLAVEELKKAQLVLRRSDNADLLQGDTPARACQIASILLSWASKGFTAADNQVKGAAEIDMLSNNLLELAQQVLRMNPKADEEDLSWFPHENP